MFANQAGSTTRAIRGATCDDHSALWQRLTTLVRPSRHAAWPKAAVELP